MHVGRSHEFLHSFLAHGEQVQRRYVVFFHYLGGGLVEANGVADVTALRARRHRRGVAPDQLGPGLLHADNQLVQVFFVLVDWHLHLAALFLGKQVFPIGPHVFQVVQAPVKVY